MQFFTCPFCGSRPEPEFHFIAETGKVRPEPSSGVTANAFANYLYGARNPRGATGEIWSHTTCGELFAMDRNSLAMTVFGSASLRGDPT